MRAADVLIRVCKGDMGQDDSRRYVEILTTNLEHFGDIIDKNPMELAAKRAPEGGASTATGLAAIRTFAFRASGGP
jgi:phosphate:Na+ symporter